MKLKKTPPPPATTHAETFFESASFGGDDKCLHKWTEPLHERLRYSGPVPAGMNAWDARPYGSRCLACGRVNVYVSLSRTIPS